MSGVTPRPAQGRRDSSRGAKRRCSQACSPASPTWPGSAAISCWDGSTACPGLERRIDCGIADCGHATGRSAVATTIVVLGLWRRPNRLCSAAMAIRRSTMARGRSERSPRDNGLLITQFEITDERRYYFEGNGLLKGRLGDGAPTTRAWTTNSSFGRAADRWSRVIPSGSPATSRALTCTSWTCWR